MNLPNAYIDKMKTLLGHDFDAYMETFQEGRRYGLRVNTLKISVEEFEKICPFSIEKIPWINNGFFYDENEQPAKHPYYYAGLYYLQEPSAMTPASRLPIDQGDFVLDLCAAPGGKATELAAKLNGTGLLVANDISRSRAIALLKNIELFGVDSPVVTTENPSKLSSCYAEFFDKVLIDAPCSGEGMFRKDKALIKEWEQNGPEYYASLQREIVLHGVDMLKPGGSMLYSTCTFSREENEDIIQFILQNRPQMKLIPMEQYDHFSQGLDQFQDAVRIFPHKIKGEGHFLALLKKENGDNPTKQMGNGVSKWLSKDEKKYFDDFFREVDLDFSKGILTRNESLLYYIAQPSVDQKGIHFMRKGLLLGEIKKNRFEPSQALAMVLTQKRYPYVINFSVQDERVIRYLKGESIYLEDAPLKSTTGWYLICVDGYSLGWGKYASGMIKNKYYPGWRWM